MYSQTGEEHFILEGVKDATRKRLLDIGAWDPKCFSNSRALIEQGWEAVLIEPSPGPLRNLVKEYAVNHFAGRMDGAPSRVTVLAAAVAVEPGIVELTVTDDAVTTSEPAKAELWKEKGGYIGKMSIPGITIGQILGQYGEFDFVNIDTEGTAVDLLKVLLATEMFPKCICVEHDSRFVEAENAGRARGYRVLYMSGENIVFGR